MQQAQARVTLREHGRERAMNLSPAEGWPRPVIIRPRPVNLSPAVVSAPANASAVVPAQANAPAVVPAPANAPAVVPALANGTTRATSRLGTTQALAPVERVATDIEEARSHMLAPGVMSAFISTYHLTLCSLVGLVSTHMFVE